MEDAGPFPGESACRFAFEGEDALYRDHLGQRVIADVSGRGWYFASGAVAVVFADGERASDTYGTFRESLLALGRPEGGVWVDVGLGRDAAARGVAEEVEGPWGGCGWVVGADRAFELDGMAEPAQGGRPTLPAPFFRSIDSAGTFRVIRGGLARPELLASLALGDASSLEAADWRVQNLSAIETLQSTFPNLDPFKGSVASHLNGASFVVDVPGESIGLLVERRYDRFHGRQRARVLVDGAFAGWWYAPREDRRRRWAMDRFGIPAHLCRAGRVRLSIDPPAGAPLWSVSGLCVWGLRAA